MIVSTAVGLVLGFVVLRYLSVETSNQFLKIAVRAVSIPIVTYAAGSLLFLVSNLVALGRCWNAETWLCCCLFFGLPVSLVFTWLNPLDPQA